MSCASCSVSSKDGKPSGCGSKGGCLSGGCNRLNTYDWLAGVELPEHEEFDLAEVSFKNGSRKAFFHNSPRIGAVKNDMVVVESGSGFDVGKVSLTGELVKLQIKRKKVKKNTVFHRIIRIAHPRDLEKLAEARALEQETMVRARVIARTLDLDMKVGDVEYQGDKRKATFYYTANGRVDFRELIRHYAKEFKVKIEMRQIGARQESARIGGLGACGRELCCSTWLTNFKSVSTSAARYQNLAINQVKLSGQCGRLKCCLNYELNTYMEALKQFPKRADNLYTLAGDARLIKMDIFKGLMFYAYKNNSATRGKVFALTTDRVKEIKAMNKKGEKPDELQGVIMNDESSEEDADLGFADVTGQIELPPEERKKRRRNRNRNNRTKDNQKQQKTNKTAKPVTKSTKNAAHSQSRSKKQNTQKQAQPPSTKDNTNKPTSDKTAKPPRKRPPRKPRPPKNNETKTPQTNTKTEGNKPNTNANPENTPKPKNRRGRGRNRNRNAQKPPTDNKGGGDNKE